MEEVEPWVSSACIVYMLGIKFIQAFTQASIGKYKYDLYHIYFASEGQDNYKLNILEVYSRVSF